MFLNIIYAMTYKIIDGKGIIPELVSVIESGAFRDRESLTSIEIPYGVKEIGNEAFDGCINLQAIVLPNSVTKIGESAFSGCRSLTSIEIPDSVTIIGENAFKGCESLNSIMIPANTTAECWGKVFSSCSNLFTIVVSKNNAKYKSINNSILSKDGKGLLLCRSAIIPEGVTMIAKSAFEGCNLTEIEIPEGGNRYR